MPRRLIALSFFILISFTGSAQFNCQTTKYAKSIQANTPSINNNGKSDTLDVLHYNLDLDFNDVGQGSMRGICTLTMTPKLNGVTKVNLDFLTLHVDSVKLNDTITPTYSFSSGPDFPVTLPSAMDVGDTFTLAIHYYGSPIDDASGWGGFHFNNPYFFNLGIGFAANPHTMGRAWFPCFDNFVEKSTYSFQVKTRAGRKAYCNGIRTLLDTTSYGGDTVVSHWEQTDPIPTYLASVAISNYEERRFNHNGMPFLVLARSNDTADVTGSFTNLTQIYDAFVNAYGIYRWQKVGYALTTIGAMEHATSIHYPRNLVNGNLASEDIIAHELAHHWFGNLITCETAEDMWINEGMAEYLSHQYQEVLYGRARYEQVVVANHDLVLNQAPLADGGHLALYGLPNELTYGLHTYQKGALVGHNLRTYLGDPAFFNGLQTLLALNAYGNLNSIEFRDKLMQITGNDLTSFFNDWVFNPGYPEFNIDSMRVVPNALPESTVKLGVSQRQFASTNTFTNVPLQITFHDSTGQVQHHKVRFKDGDTTYTLLNAFKPYWAAINQNGYLLDGVSADDFNIKSTGILSNNRSKMDIKVVALQDSATLRAEHHWAGPSVTGNEPFRISKNHYWRVTGYLPPSFQAEATLTFSSNANNNFIDEDLLANGEDSLILVYRKDATENWREYDWYSKNYFGSPNNKFGRITVQVLVAGEYAFANGVSAFSIGEENAAAFKLYPNPTKELLLVDFGNLPLQTNWSITDNRGILIMEGKKEFGSDSLRISISPLKPGTYFFSANGFTQKFVIQ